MASDFDSCLCVSWDYDPFVSREPSWKCVMWKMRSMYEFRVNDYEKKTISLHIPSQQLCLGAHKLSGSPKVLKLDLIIEILKYHIIDA